MRNVVAILCAVLASGCVSTTPTGYWYRDSDGRRVDATEATLATFNKDRVICDGKAAEAAMTRSVNLSEYNNQLINLIFDGCLNERGYTRKPE
ncbi:hypothetical protein EDC90_103349 [Martelella mediterranea]|uniref:Lipoprotein n=1 Tax=Martelella mediterranea TaxID=293089 RepID=A0A4V2V3M5_9HYPH|nr:hypothetical protein EDC90_103349 [Martelella mediterranea]